MLVEEFSGYIHRGDRLGLIGPNGAGKSTLLRTLIGELEPAGGTLRLGNSIAVAYYRQDLTQVPTDRSLYDVIAELRPTWERGQVQGHLGRFGFPGDEVQRRADSLSGGERARVALAMMMLARANLLILDEPTNHLDVESIESLEESLEGYDGTIIIVSHDRALLRNLVTRVWSLSGGRIEDIEGGFDEWEAFKLSREKQARAAAQEQKADPKRAKEKPESVMYATSGNGSINHLLSESLNVEAGIKMVHVPYKAIAAAITDVSNGTVDNAFASVQSVLPLI